jgi:MFS transporter, ACS family, tartrate transporter
MAGLGNHSDVGRSARKRIAWRLLPFLFVLYVVAFLDRTNVGAAALQMPKDLGFSEKVMGLGAGMFFIGYLVLEIPGALIAERWSARKWIARIMITWGIITLAMAFVRTTREFFLVRFLLGAAEAGFFPAVIVYITHWFRAPDRARAMARFHAANPLSFVIGSPLAGVLLGLAWFGLHGWRWLFILEGIPAIVAGVVTAFYLTDWPRQAKWLRAEEREWIAAELEEENRAKKAVRAYSVLAAIRERDVLLLTLCYFFATTGGYGLAFWLPTIVKRLSGQSDLRVTVLVALPYLAGFATQQLNSWHSDKTGERRWHAGVPIFIAGIMLALAVLGERNVPVAIGFFTLAGAAYFAFHPCFWSVPTMFLSESAAAASIGLINSLGNLGGFFGPMIIGYLAAKTHTFTPGLLYLVGSLFLSGVSMLLVGTGQQKLAGTPEAGPALNESRVRESKQCPQENRSHSLREPG